MFLERGKAFHLGKDNWSGIRSLRHLEGKIHRVHPSPSYSYSIHLPKYSPLLAIHENKPNCVVMTIPIPFNYIPEEPSNVLQTCTDVEGNEMLVCQAYERISDIPFVFGQKSKTASKFSSRVKHFTVSDNGKIIALIFEDELWIWNQFPDGIMGTGFWFNVAKDDSFNYRKFPSGPTHPTAYHSLVAFHNPDEGSGVCWLSVLLPPSRPFDTLYLLNTVVKFEGTEKKYFHYRKSFPVLDGTTRPRVFWSPCGRVLLVTVNSSVILLTRNLQIISVNPLSEVFPGDKPYFSGMAWSCTGQFFVITSTTGFIGVITRSGETLKHCVCDLPPFNDGLQIPLHATADLHDPTLFFIYSHDKMRPLRIDISTVKQTIENLISLPFPLKSTVNLLGATVELLNDIDVSQPYEVVRILYVLELFSVFQYQSPLRYLILEHLNDTVATLLAMKKYDLFCYFLVRNVFRVTDYALDSYIEIMERLKLSTNKRDKFMYKILDDELNRRDWNAIVVQKNEKITYTQSPLDEDTYILEHHQADDYDYVDLKEIALQILDLMYNPDFTEIDEIPVDLSVLMELMVELGRFDRAMLIAHHNSVCGNPYTLYTRMISVHPSDPVAIFRAMDICCTASPNDENSIRAACVQALTNILKQKISESAPSAKNPKLTTLSKFCMIEESVEVPIPENEEQCDDFAIVLGLAFAACDYVNIENYLNGRSTRIRDDLRAAIQKLFKVVWFVRWRYSAMKETQLTRCPGDATLRLLLFPEFMDTVVLRSAIESIGPKGFSEKLFDFYMKQGKEYEMDPDFVDFAIECEARISPRSLSRIQLAVEQFADPMTEIPKSSILLSCILSHIIPWLRGGIPRAMVAFPAKEVIPNELLDFEDFSLPEYPKPDLKVQTLQKNEIVQKPLYATFDKTVDFNISSDSSLEELQLETENVPPPQPETPPLPAVIPEPELREDYLSEGEEPPQPKHEHVKKEEHIKHKAKKEKMKDKKKQKIRLIHIERDPKPKYQPAPFPTSANQPLMQSSNDYGYAPMGMIGNPPPIAIFQTNPAPMPTQSYGPIWDLDPACYERPYPKPPPDIPRENQDIPIKASVQTQSNNVIRKNIYITDEKKQKKGDYLDISDSSISELNDESGPDRDEEPIDPFPLDEELSRRVDALLREDIPIKPKPLPEPPKYTKVYKAYVPT